MKSKGGVTQVDISAEFQTKQLASRLLGYYTINGPTHGTRLQLDYQFYKNPKQTIKIEGLYSERSMGFRHDVYGELAMDSTAYPVYNFYSVLSNIVSMLWCFIKVDMSNVLDPANNITILTLPSVESEEIRLYLTKNPMMFMSRSIFAKFGLFSILV